jgi:chromate transport protein ChrA
MGTLLRAVIVLLASVTTALAANSTVVKGSTFLLILFLGFAALIIVFQFIPGLVLFATMLKGLFSRAPKKETETLSEKPGGK